MKKSYFILLLAITSSLFSCKKNHDTNPTPNPVPATPSLTTAPVTAITDSSAVSGGDIANNDAEIIARGIEWDTSTLFNNGWKSTNGSGTGSFSANLTGLFPSTGYYVRAYAQNAQGTFYGDTLQFTASYTPGKYTVTTFAGTGAAGSLDGSTGTATFHAPDGISIDAAGNIYVADGSNKIRKISTAGTVSTLANVNSTPSDVAVDSMGNVYVAMTQQYDILKISPGGATSVFAGGGAGTSTDGTGTSAAFAGPVTLDFDASGNLYVGDSRTFRKITPAAVVTTLPGNFKGYDFAIAVDNAGNIYEADQFTINSVDTANAISFLAGGQQAGSQDGTGSAAGFNYIEEMKIGPDGNIYVADAMNHKIRMVTPAGVVTTIAGTGAQGALDGNSAVATFGYPTGLAIDKAGNIYVADLTNNKIRKISPL